MASTSSSKNKAAKSKEKKEKKTKEVKSKEAKEKKTKGKKKKESTESEVGEEIAEGSGEKDDPMDEDDVVVVGEVGVVKTLEVEEHMYAVLLNEVTKGYGKIRLEYHDWYKMEVGKYAPPLGRAKINDRPITEERTQGMMASFASQGFSRSEGKALRMALKNEWYTTKLADRIEGVAQPEDSVPWIEFTAAGQKAAEEGLFNPVEGLGRRTGVELYIKIRLDAIAQEKKRLAKYKEQPEKRGEDIKECRLAIARLRADVEHASWWPFRIIDWGESITYLNVKMLMMVGAGTSDRLMAYGEKGKKALLFWSENNRKFETFEQDDEALVRVVRGFQTAREDDAKAYKEEKQANPDVAPQTKNYDEEFLKVTTKHSGTNFTNVWYNPMAIEYIEALLDLPMHFRTCLLVKIGNVNKNMCHVQGGVSEIF